MKCNTHDMHNITLITFYNNVNKWSYCAKIKYIVSQSATIINIYVDGILQNNYNNFQNWQYLTLYYKSHFTKDSDQIVYYYI